MNADLTTKNFSVKKYYKLIFILFLGFLIATSASKSFAAAATTTTTNDAISQTLCNVIAKLNGPIGKGIATIAIIVLGIGLFLGKLSWAVAVATAIGIGLIFGASNMVSWIGAGTNTGAPSAGGASTTLSC